MEVLTNISLVEFINQHYISHYMSFSPKDVMNEIKRIYVIENSEFAKLNISNISRHDIMMFLCKIQYERNLTKSTVNRYRSRISAIMNYALDEGYIFNNPIRKIKRYKEKPRSRALSTTEIERLLAECKASRNQELYIIVVLALNTGMRKNEILSLKRENINLINQNIILEEKQTKSGESRLVPLNKAAMKVLKTHIKKNKNSFIFKSCCIRSAYEYAMKRAGIEQARFHDLRRTFATHLKDKGISLHTIMKLLGHSSILMTERYLSIQSKVLLDGVSKIDFN